MSLTTLAEPDWYTHVSIQGRVTRITDDDGLVDIDRLSSHYTGRDYPTRDRARVSVHVTVEKWHGWGKARRS